MSERDTTQPDETPQNDDLHTLSSRSGSPTPDVNNPRYGEIADPTAEDSLPAESVTSPGADDPSSEEVPHVRKSREDLPAAFADIAIVAVLAAIYNWTAGVPLGLKELTDTALPFWSGLLIGHVIVTFIRRNPRTLVWGTFIWVAAWSLGSLGMKMLLFDLSLNFVLLAGATLALGFLGWRLTYLGWKRVSAARE